jgi:hypothetical protein
VKSIISNIFSNHEDIPGRVDFLGAGKRERKWMGFRNGDQIPCAMGIFFEKGLSRFGILQL